VDLNKITKDEYVNYKIGLIDQNLASEEYEDFCIKYKKEYKKNPDFWVDFMELDQSDLSDLQVFACGDKNFLEFVIDNPNIINDEVFNKIEKKISNKKSEDHIQIDIETYTGGGKSTLMRAIGLKFFPNFCIDDIFYMKKDLLDYVATHHEHSYKSVKVLDEDVKSSGIGSVRSEQDLSQLFESCRKAQLSYIGCHAIVKHENQTVFYRFFIFAKNMDRRLTCASVYRNNTCIGFIYVRIPYSRKFFELEYDYEKKKDAFILSTMKNENKETLDVTGCAKKVLANPEIQAMIRLGKCNKKIIKMKVYELFNNYTMQEQDIITSKVYIIQLCNEVGENPDEPPNKEMLDMLEKDKKDFEERHKKIKETIMQTDENKITKEFKMDDEINDIE
jgi:hypothetical protein